MELPGFKHTGDGSGKWLSLIPLFSGFLIVSVFIISLFVAMSLIQLVLVLEIEPGDLEARQFVLPALTGFIISLIIARLYRIAYGGPVAGPLTGLFAVPDETDDTWFPVFFYLRYIVASIIFIAPFALIQQIYFFEIDPVDINFKKFIIPVVVAGLFGLFLGNQVKLKTMLTIKNQSLHEKDEQLNALNESLETIAARRATELIQEKRMSRAILDIQPNMVILTDGFTIQDANLSFIQTFIPGGTIEDFQLRYGSFSRFIKTKGEMYETKNDLPWVKFLAENPEQHEPVEINHGSLSRFYDVQSRKLDDSIGRELYVVTLSDVNQLVQIKEQLKNQLYLNTLTGLPNRFRLNRDSKKGHNGILLINIDGFQEVNNFFGHKTGDQILIETGSQIIRKLNDLETELQVYHIGGDEFALLLPAEMDLSTIRNLCDALQDSFRMITQVPDSTLSTALGITIGVVLPGTALPAEMELINAADTALKEARRKRAGIHIFQNIGEKHVENELNLRRAMVLKEAVSENRIIPLFQPILNLKTGDIDKYESLVRIRTRDGKMVPPSEFLGVARTTRMYSEITRRMFNESCLAFEDRTEQFSINLTMDDINNPDLTRYMKMALRMGDLGKRTVFEIVESQGIDNFELINHFIAEFKELGVRFAIDDFGSGFSNYEYLLKLNVDYLKVDSSLIRNVDRDRNALLIVASILDFAHSLEIETIAEFVHSEEVMKTITSLGFDYAQGFFIGEPDALPAFSI